MAEERAELAVTQLLGTKLVPSSAEYETDSRSCNALCAVSVKLVRGWCAVSPVTIL